MNNESEGSWRNDNHVELYAFLAGAELRTVAVDELPAWFQNLSSNFQVRHVLDPNKRKGFTYFVNIHSNCLGGFFEGTNQETYDLAAAEGKAVAEEQLRRSFLNLERR